MKAKKVLDLLFEENTEDSIKNSKDRSEGALMFLGAVHGLLDMGNVPPERFMERVKELMSAYVEKYPIK